MKQLSAEKGTELSVCVVEKGAQVGSHVLSGNVLEPRALNELLPDWKDLGAPLDTPVTKDKFLLLTEKKAFALPHFLLPREEVRDVWTCIFMVDERITSNLLQWALAICSIMKAIMSLVSVSLLAGWERKLRRMVSRFIMVCRPLRCYNVRKDL